MFRGTQRLFLLAALAAACSDSSSPNPPPPPPPPSVTGVSVAPGAVTLTGVGAQGSVQATLAPAGVSATVTWRSEDPAVATVSASGLIATITAVGRGSTRVVAAVGSIEGATQVTVTVPSVTAIAVTPGRDTLLTGATRQLAAAVTADQGVDPSVTWSSQSTAVATVSGSGLVTAVAPGTTTITATSVATPTVSATATIVVRTPTVTAVTVAPATTALFVTETTQLAATVQADAGANQAVTWSSADLAIASVSPAGLVTALAAGTTTVRATSVANPAIQGSATITVTNPTPLTSWAAQIVGPWDRAHWERIDGLYSLANGDAFAEIFPGGIGSTRIARRTNGTWAPADILPFDQLNHVGGSGNDLWIGSTTGRLARWNGTTFVETASPITGPVVSLEGAGPGAFVAGVNNSSTPRVLVYSAGNWTALTAASPLIITSVSGRSPTDLAATFLLSGSVARWNGTNWSFLPTPGFSLVAAHLDQTSTDVIVGGIGGSARWNGSAWQQLPLPAARAGAGTEIFRNILRCGGQVYAATQGRVFRLGVNAWEEIAGYGVAAMGSNANVLGCGGDNVLRVGGTDGSIARWTGTTWIQEAFTPQINGVKVVSSQLAWAVGAAGVVFRWDGASWRVDHQAFTSFKFNAVSGLADGFTMVTGAASPNGIWRRQNGTWTLDPTPAVAEGIWVQSPTFAVATSNGGLLHWNGSAWAAAATPAGGFLRSVSGTSATFALAAGSAGASGRIVRWDGTTWTTMTIPAVGSVNDIAAVSPTAAFAVGSNYVLKWDGTTWTTLALPAFMTPVGSTLGRIAAVSGTEVYVTNFTGAVFRWDGVNWSQTTQLSLPDVPANRLTTWSISAVPGFGLIGATGGAVFRGIPGTFALRSRRP
ncbi:MAG: Ig-like domain-containing protein [Gemmatimonadales bacterium]|nr:Ig-like domain-containing protein [Gemmatimonadales bacterium]